VACPEPVEVACPEPVEVACPEPVEVAPGFAGGNLTLKTVVQSADCADSHRF